MKKRLFNRILHLLEARAPQDKRMIGLGAKALWELWQRIAVLDQTAKQQARRLGRKRQSGGGRKQEAEALCRLLVRLLYLRQHWTMQVVAESIGCCEATVWNYIHEMLPYIRDELPASLLEQWQPRQRLIAQKVLIPVEMARLHSL